MTTSAIPQTTPHAATPAVPPYRVAVWIAAATAGSALAIAILLGLPLRDPDGLAGPAYVRLPAIMALLFALDVLPRAVARARGASGVGASLRSVVVERWSRPRAKLVVIGLLSFYLTYVGYRNLKSFLPFAREDLVDPALLGLDRAIGLGADPPAMLHALLGTGVAAHVLSAVYVFFLGFVPLSLGAALVWARDLRTGYWYVTALCANWALGALSYYLLPSLGPVFVMPEAFSALPETPVSRLQDTLLEHRVEVLADPHATLEVHGIAAFASLHVSIVFTAALVAQLAGLARAVRVSLWTFFGLTVVATVYFGWHYVIDDVAGIAIGVIAVWIGAVAVGRTGRRRSGRAGGPGDGARAAAALEPGGRREPARDKRDVVRA